MKNTLWLTSVAVCTAINMYGKECTESARTDARPNILFCLADDVSFLSGEHTGASGCGLRT